MFKAMSRTIVESKLLPVEKRKFDAAKDKALVPWLENSKWERYPRNKAKDEECCPLRFLLKYKMEGTEQMASARVILQGFKHIDVLSKKPDVESPTMPGRGRHTIYFWAVTKGWKLFGADVKSAFLQSEDIVENQGLRIFGVPSADMRRRLEPMMGLRPDEVLLMRKPPFGDPRAPRLWNSTFSTAMSDLAFVTHPLENCVFLSTRLARKDDDPFEVFHVDDKKRVVDGLLGLHVDDYLGLGENVNSQKDIEIDPDARLWL